MNLREIKDLCEKATAGPWKAYTNPMRDDGLFVGQDKPDEFHTNGIFPPIKKAVPDLAWCINCQIEPENARFIAAARTAIPVLIKALEIAAYDQYKPDEYPCLMDTCALCNTPLQPMSCQQVTRDGVMELWCDECVARYCQAHGIRRSKCVFYSDTSHPIYRINIENFTEDK